MKTKNIVILLVASVFLFSIIDRISWKLFEADIKFLKSPLRILGRIFKGIRGFLIFSIILSTLLLFAKEK